jgi:hypothetical protein
MLLRPFKEPMPMNGYFAFVYVEKYRFRILVYLNI